MLNQFFKRPLLSLEIFTLIILMGVDLLWAGRPMLEGWAHLLQFNESGFQAFFPEVTARFLEQVPIGIAWLIGQGSINGLIITFALIVLGKYIVARWAIRPLINSSFLWVLATLAAIMVPWNEQWYAHNLSAQFASLCLFITLGACVRLRDNYSVKYILIAFVSLLISLLTYEALMLCALAIPIAIIFSDNQPLHLKKKLFIRTFSPIFLGLLVYVLFYYGAQNYNSTGMTYHEQLLSGPQPIKYPYKLVAYLYYTTYFNSPWTYPFLMLFLMALIGPTLLKQENTQRISLQLFILGTILLLLPLFSLIYAVNFYFLSDLERACLPVGFAYFLFTFATVAKISPTPEKNFPISIVLVIALLIGTTVNVYTAYQPYRLQRSVLNQVKPILQENKAQSILVRDWTGRLGDRYTFQYMNVISNALMLEGIPVRQLSLCTSDGIDRIHPMMEKMEGHTQIPRCSELAADKTTQFVIDVRNTNKPLNPIIIPHGFEAGVSAAVTRGTLGGEEVRDNTNFHWINNPTGTVTLENKTNTTLKVQWEAKLIPPPCNSKMQVKFIVDKKSFLFPCDSKFYSFKTKVDAKNSKTIHFRMIGPVCHYGNPPGDFYMGILGMQVGTELSLPSFS